MNQLRERIQLRLDEIGKTPRAASLASGMSSTVIRDIFRRPEMAPTIETIRKLAAGLDTTPEWLAFGLKAGVSFGGAPSDTLSPPSPDTVTTDVAPPTANGIMLSPHQRFVKVIYGGPVEAGSWRTVEDFDDFAYSEDERPPLWEPPDREFPDLELTQFDVVGDSMNALKPRAIMPGDKVVGIPFAAFKGNFALRDGIVVIVEQTTDGGHHRERSVKQVELYEDRIEFHPRSTNKKHKPIVVPRTVFTDPSEGDGREVNVLAIARRISNELPL